MNINSERSSKGNSLYFNILEAVKSLGIVDKKFYKSLLRLGHKKTKIDQALIVLSSKENRFFHPKKMVPQVQSNKIVMREEYIATCKLEMYLQMGRDWDEYIDKFGEIGDAYEVVL